MIVGPFGLLCTFFTHPLSVIDVVEVLGHIFALG